MNNLSQECIEQIVNTASQNGNVTRRYGFIEGAKASLTTPTIYQSAGLVKAEDLLPETFKTEAVNTILVNALRYLNDEQISHLLKAICQRKKDAALEAGLMTVEEALRFNEWVNGKKLVYSNVRKVWYDKDNWLPQYYTTTELLTIFRNQNQEK